MTTSTELKAGLNMVLAVAEAIREAHEIPSGTLYAMLAGRIDFQAYQKLIGILTNSGLVREQNHLLTWIGPSLSPTPSPAVPAAVSGGSEATRP